MSKLTKTRHARVRAAGRSISDRAIETVLEFGWVYRVGDGNRAWFFGKRALKKAMRLTRQKLDQFKNIAVVVSEAGQIITVLHCHKPCRHWQQV